MLMAPVSSMPAHWRSTMVSWWSVVRTRRRRDDILYWDGDSWEELGSGIEGTVYALTIGSDGGLYAGGSFSNSIKRWDGSTWNNVGSGISVPTAYSLTAIGNDVYVGGDFSGPASIFTAAGIARWDGSAWHAVEGPFDPEQVVYALTSDGLDLLAGGSFIDGGGVAEMDYLARYNGCGSFFLPLLMK